MLFWGASLLFLLEVFITFKASDEMALTIKMVCPRQASALEVEVHGAALKLKDWRKLCLPRCSARWCLINTFQCLPVGARHRQPGEIGSTVPRLGGCGH